MMSLSEPLRLFSLAFHHISADVSNTLSFVALSPPQHFKVPKNKGGSVYFVCPLPSAIESFLSTPRAITPQKTQKNDTCESNGFTVSVNGGERKWRQGWKEATHTILCRRCLLYTILENYLESCPSLPSTPPLFFLILGGGNAFAHQTVT